MRKLILGFLLAMVLSTKATAAAEDTKEACTVSSPVAGTTIIACPTYFVTKDTNGTTICRIIDGVGKILCSKVTTE